MSHYDSLSPERWSRFTLGQQILQIGAELQRGLRFLEADKDARLKPCYERALELVDLTVRVNADPGLRRELLGWRDVVAELYLRDDTDPAAHRLALRTLFEMHSDSKGQVALLGL